MEEKKESLGDKLMARIQKQAIIGGIKAALNRFPQVRQFLPFVKEGIESAKTESEKYLGNAEKLIVIGRKFGKTRLMIIDATKPFSISTGLKIEYDADKPETMIMNKEIDDYFQEVYDTGILSDISEEDMKKYEELKEKGIENVFMDITKELPENTPSVE